MAIKRKNIKISLRKANFSNIEFLWYLRNRPEVYKYSRQNGSVSWQEHIDWVLPILLGISHKELFVIENQRLPIAQIRFDYDDKKEEAEISTSILKEFHGKGFATQALNLAINKVKRQKRAGILTAEIYKKNLPSIKLFEKLNFKFQSKNKNWFKYIYKTKNG